MGWKCLTYGDRLKIEALLRAGVHKREIASVIGCSLATVYNEIRRGSVEQVDTELRPYTCYYADSGQRVRDDNCSNRGRFCKYAYDCSLMSRLRELLIDSRFSPEACARSLGCGICKGTIYNYIRAGRVDGVSMCSLPCPRRVRNKSVKVEKRNPFNNPCVQSIDVRPAEVGARSSYGHFEVDTVYSCRGSSSACLLTLTDIATRFEVIVKLPDRRASSVSSVLPALVEKYHIKSITSDNGVEFSSAPAVCGVPWYVCHSYSSYERGTNENYNRMVRRWFPKGTSFEGVSDDDVSACMDWINSYPVKRRSAEVPAGLL